MASGRDHPGFGGVTPGFGKPVPHRRRRSTLVVVGAATTAVVAAVALMAAGDDPDYQAVCADPQTGVRVDDEQCDDDGGSSGLRGFGWYYLGRGSRAVATGAKVTGGSFLAPDPTRFSVRRGGVPRVGGTISRGGFGGRFGGFGG
jgi:hypothetical protein